MQKKPMETKKSGGRRPAGNHPGGREFGNVIEPTQAQMASGNQGLAADSTRGSSKSAGKKAARGNRKAA